MSNAIQRLRSDIKDLHRVQHSRDVAKKELKKDLKELKQDRRHIGHVRDAFEDTKKELKGDRRSISQLRETARDRLGDLGDKRAELQEAYDASADPLTGQKDLGLELQLAALDQRIAGARDGFEERLGDKKQELEKLTGALSRQRGELRDTRKEIKHDRHEVKGDKKRLDRARDRVHDVRQRALDHLRPAEYEMGLKQTNKVRRELGLKPVDHVIRPDRGPGDVSGVSGAGLDGLNAKTTWAAKVARKMGLTVTSTTGGTHAPGSYHYSGRAVDVAGPASVMAKYYRFMAQKNPTELFYDPLGGIKHGQQIGAIGGHSDHVHVAF